MIEKRRFQYSMQKKGVVIVKRAQPRENNYEQICIVPRE